MIRNLQGAGIVVNTTTQEHQWRGKEEESGLCTNAYMFQKSQFIHAGLNQQAEGPADVRTCAIFGTHADLGVNLQIKNEQIEDLMSFSVIRIVKFQRGGHPYETELQIADCPIVSREASTGIKKILLRVYI